MFYDIIISVLGLNMWIPLLSDVKVIIGWCRGSGAHEVDGIRAARPAQRAPAHQHSAESQAVETG